LITYLVALRLPFTFRFVTGYVLRSHTVIATFALVTFTRCSTVLVAPIVPPADYVCYVYVYWLRLLVTLLRLLLYLRRCVPLIHHYRLIPSLPARLPAFVYLPFYRLHTRFTFRSAGSAVVYPFAPLFWFTVTRYHVVPTRSDALPVHAVTLILLRCTDLPYYRRLRSGCLYVAVTAFVTVVVHTRYRYACVVLTRCYALPFDLHAPVAPHASYAVYPYPLIYVVVATTPVPVTIMTLLTR